MQIKGKFTKLDNDRFLAFGWASVSVDEKGNVVVDSYGDTISIEELKQAAYKFVASFGTAGVPLSWVPQTNHFFQTYCIRELFMFFLYPTLPTTPVAAILVC